VTTQPPSTERSPNFGFLAYHDPRLSALGLQAERLFAADPSACLGKLRLFGEILARRAAARLGLYVEPDEKQAALIGRLSTGGALSETIVRLFHGLRNAGNRAVHEGTDDHQEALHQLKVARELAVWFQRAFGNNRKFDPGPFVPPPDPAEEDAALREALAALREALAASKVDVEAARAAADAEAKARLGKEQLAAQLEEERQAWEALARDADARRSKEVEALEARLAAELAAIQAQAVAQAPAVKEAAVHVAAQAAQAVELSEADTRRIVDEQLQEAGWEADTRALTHASGARPQKGKNLAIAEWPTKSGPVDYAVFVGLDLVAVIEAKRMSVDVPDVLAQASRYSHGVRLDGQAQVVGGPWGDGHEVPFLFATNGRPYLKQLETKSGIWFRDTRRAQNLARALDGWYTPDGLAALLKQDVDAAHEKLRSEPTGYLDLRPYQIRAIQAVERTIEDGKRACLVAMATGTGKTRTAICLVYRLLKAQRFRRVLFLVDRGALGEQTENALKDLRIENLQTFAEIYNIKGLDEVRPDPATKLHVATIQGMVKRVLNPTTPGEMPSVDQYDCIVVDECHRGYTLDQELGEAELRFRDLDDYISKYRRVLDHFDAVKIGLTATPAKHTSEIFGKPVFLYSYREAVIDGCLVDHEPPVLIVTALAEDGIVWNKGDKMRLYDPRKAAERLVDAPDEVKFDVEGFNKKVITEGFNRVVCAELAKQIDPTLPAKAIVFCATDAHADMVVKLLKEAFAAQYGEVEDGAVLKITGNPSVDRPLERIRHFKNERLPNVAVTVDLLSTGIDVPPVSNIVFLRRVQSRILYEQMLGRATRLCPQIEKTSFRIFDAVALYDALEDMTSMTPVVADVSIPAARAGADHGAGRRGARARAGAARGQAAAQAAGARGGRARAVREHRRDVARRRGADAEGEHARGRGGMVRGAQLPGAVPRQPDGRGPAGSDLGSRGPPAGRGARLRQDEAAAGGLPRGLPRLPAREPERGAGAAAGDAAAAGSDARRAAGGEARARQRGLRRGRAAGGVRGRGERGDRRVDHGVHPAGGARGSARALRAAGGPRGREDRGERAWTPVQRRWLDRIAKQIKADEVVDRASVDEGQFKADGGFARLDKVFEGRLEEVLGDLREAIWEKAAG
jgi:type I restriction enzyme, R subunit